MREQLIDDCEGLYLCKSRTDKNQCVYSTAPVPEGVHGVRIRMTIRDNSYGTWLSVTSADDLADSIDRFDAETSEVGEELSPSGHVKYNTVRGEHLSCAVCAESLPKGSTGISFHNPVGFSSQTVWIHTRCCDRFVTGLERVWEYSDDILPERV